MYIDFLLDAFQKNRNKEAMIWNDRNYLYQDLLDQVTCVCKILEKEIPDSSVVALEADFSPRSTAILLYLIEHCCIVVPLTKSVENKKDCFIDIAEVEIIIEIREDDKFEVKRTERTAKHGIICGLKENKHPGLVVFSSGSTGESKAAVHDFLPLLSKFKKSRKCMRMITFLLFDHLGGINTLLYILSNAGCIVALNSRKPEYVCANIEKYKVEALPTSPTFINLLILSEAYKRFDLSSLKLVTYGTEAMPESTLKRFHELFPNIRLQQTYGLSELGVMRSKSKSSDSLWVKVGGEDFQTRVVDGILEIKAKSAMLGYLNAPSPFTEDGWFHTGDEVLVDGEYIRILGRKSEMINVGGQKVFPAEVESVIQQMDDVEDASVNAEDSMLTGQIVKLRVKLSSKETAAEFKKRMRIFCKDKLEPYKIPQKVEVVDHLMFGERFKKMRREP